jgi:hypothetical protein
MKPKGKRRKSYNPWMMTGQGGGPSDDRGSLGDPGRTTHPVLARPARRTRPCPGRAEREIAPRAHGSVGHRQRQASGASGCTIVGPTTALSARFCRPTCGGLHAWKKPCPYSTCGASRRVTSRKRWRKVNAPHLVALVKAGVKYPNGQAEMFSSEPAPEEMVTSIPGILATS